MSSRVTPGLPAPLGVTPDAHGVNVAVHSSSATRIEFCLFDADGNVELERATLEQRSGDVFHAHVGGVDAGRRYGLRAHGPYAPESGLRFNPAKLLVDPYALRLDRRFALHPSQNGFGSGDPLGADAIDRTDSAPFVPKAIVTDRRALAGATSLPEAIKWPDTIIYELHVRGFTQRHPQIPAQLRGRFAALAHPAALAHLRRIGVTTIELMPAAAWIDERHLPALGLSNYWGYNPVAMLAPDPLLAPGGWVEVRAAVEALHAAGIEVILDVVLNHSGESDEFGPTLSLRGLDNAGYYRLAPDAPARYIDDTGCGNCLALARPAVVELACAALRTWVELGGVDGFRFDLGTTLGRRDDGFDARAPLLEAIAADPLLGTAKLIVEPWDVGPGGYQLGRFPERFAEWNDRFRDDARRFWRGDAGARGDLATRLAGSADMFAAKQLPSRGINFVAAHDGFTLADVVAFAHKHNDANGEHGRDGSDANFSWNHGVEGNTADAQIVAARVRDQRNLLATLLLARGTPMLAMGAELGHSQHGNNNAYAQDNELSWLAWTRIDEDLIDFVAALVALRRKHPALRADAFLAGAPPDDAGIVDVEWRTADATLRSAQDWNERDGDPLVAVLYVAAAHENAADRVAIVLQRADATTVIALPAPRPGHVWHCEFDSAHPHLAAPTDRPDAFAIAPRSACVFAEAVIAGARRDEDRGASDRSVAAHTLAQLAAAAGIAADWWEVDGTRHVVSPDTQRALLAAMRLPAATLAQARESLVRIAAVRERRTLPFALAASEEEPIEMPVVAEDGSLSGTLLVRDEAGTIVATVACPDAFESNRRDVSGFVLRAARAQLPALGVGRYDVFRDADPDLVCRLTVAPRTCFRPEWLAAGGRRFGLSAQAYALRRAGDGGIGDFSAIGELGAAAARHGAVTLGISPLHMLFPHARDRASPYHPSDRRFLDPIYLDVGALQDVPGFAGAVAHAPMPAPDNSAAWIDYAATWSRKRVFLEHLFDAFESIAQALPNDARVREHAAFVAAGGTDLATFAAFESISATDPARRWQDWPAVLRDADGAAVRTLIAGDGRRLRFARFLQWLAERQLAQTAAQVRDAGLTLGLYRDLAVGCAPDGAEAWATQRQLARGVSIGAPPDPLGPQGQVWHLPPPDPLAWRETAFASLRSVVAANMRHAGALRIDHALGLARLFWVPDGAGAADGAYVHYPLAALVGEIAFESRRASCVVIGEDLGTVPAGLRETLADAGMLSYRVLMLERERSEFRSVGSYPASAIACVATHDLPPLAGWWAGDDLHERHALGLLAADAFDGALATRTIEKRELLHALVREAPAPDIDIEAAIHAPLPDEIWRALHLWLARAPSALMLVQAEDLARERVAQNLPGTDRERPNWRRRLGVDGPALLELSDVRALLAALAAERPPEAR